MNKENVISHGATAIATIVVGAIALHFIGTDYAVAVGYIAGLCHRTVKPEVEKLLFKR